MKPVNGLYFWWYAPLATRKMRQAIPVTSALPHILELLGVKESGIEQILLSPEGKKGRIIETLKHILQKRADPSAHRCRGGPALGAKLCSSICSKAFAVCSAKFQMPCIRSLNDGRMVQSTQCPFSIPKIALSSSAEEAVLLTNASAPASRMERDTCSSSNIESAITRTSGHFSFI